MYHLMQSTAKYQSAERRDARGPRASGRKKGLLGV